MAHPTYLACNRCSRILATAYRGRLRIGQTEAKVVGFAWLYCPEAGCGGWYVWRPKRCANGLGAVVHESTPTP